jgi:hypothetical protein
MPIGTAYNQIYPLRSLRCRGSSRARHSGHEDRGQSTSGTLVLCFAASGLRHISPYGETSGKFHVVCNAKQMKFSLKLALRLCILAVIYLGVAEPVFASGNWSPTPRSIMMAAIFAPLAYWLTVLLCYGIFLDFTRFAHASTEIAKSVGIQVLGWFCHLAVSHLFSIDPSVTFVTSALLTCATSVYLPVRALGANSGNLFLLILFHAMLSAASPFYYLIFTIFGR